MSRSSSISSLSIDDDSFRTMLRRAARSPTPPNRPRRKPQAPRGRRVARGAIDTDWAEGDAPQPYRPPRHVKHAVVRKTQRRNSSSETSEESCAPVDWWSTIPAAQVVRGSAATDSAEVLGSDPPAPHAGRVYCFVLSKYLPILPVPSGDSRTLLYVPRIQGFVPWESMPPTGFAVRLAERWQGLRPMAAGMSPQPEIALLALRRDRLAHHSVKLRCARPDLRIDPHPAAAVQLPVAAGDRRSDLLRRWRRLDVVSPGTSVISMFTGMIHTWEGLPQGAPQISLLTRSRVHCCVAHRTAGLLFGEQDAVVGHELADMPARVNLRMPGAGRIRALCQFADGFAASIESGNALVLLSSWDTAPIRIGGAPAVALSSAFQPASVLVGQRNGWIGIVDSRQPAPQDGSRHPVNRLTNAGSVSVHQLECLNERGFIARTADGAVAVYDFRQQGAVHSIAPPIHKLFFDQHTDHGAFHILRPDDGEGSCLVGFSSGLNRFDLCDWLTGDVRQSFDVDGCNFASQMAFGSLCANTSVPSTVTTLCGGNVRSYAAVA